METTLEYGTLLVPLLAYLISRALVSAAGSRSGSAAYGFLVAAGAAFASAGRRIAPGIGIGSGPASALITDAVCALALFALGSGVGSARKLQYRQSEASWKLMGHAAHVVVPALFGLGLALLMGPAERLPPLPTAILALALASAFWLSVEASWPSLAASSVALAFVSHGPSPGLLPALWSAGAAAIILVVLAISAKTRRNPFKSFVFPLRLGFALAVRTAGASWSAAGLATGLLGRWMRSLSPRGSNAGKPGTGADGAMALGLRESTMALAFVAGLNLSIEKLLPAIPMTMLLTIAFIASSAVSGFIAGRRIPALPTEAFALAALLAGQRAGLSMEPAIAAAALALILSAPFTRPGAAGIRITDGRAPYKSIVGVSQRADNVCAVEFAAAIGNDGDPVRAVCVATAPGTDGPESAQAEDALVHCVLAGTSAGIRILPSVLVANGVAEGLARAAVDRHADAVILGASGKSGAAGEGGSNLTRLLALFPDSVISIRKPDRFPASRRIVIVAVAGAGMGPGFSRAIAAIHRAWGQSTKLVDALMVGGPASTLVEASRGFISLRATKSVQSWRDAPAALGALASRDAGFIIFVARPGSPTWNPGHERLPVVLAGAYPESSIALWFTPMDGEPAEPAIASPQDDGEQQARPEHWPPLLSAAYASGRVLTDLHDAALVDAVRRLTDAIFPNDRGLAGRLATDFSVIARKEPIELAPGILLLHGHAKGLSIPVLAVGATMTGWPLVALPSPVKIVVVLVSPDDAGPEIHLEALTQIALAFRNLSLADHLLGDRKT